MEIRVYTSYTVENLCTICRAYGSKEFIISPKINKEDVAFTARFEVNYFVREPGKYNEGSLNSIYLAVIANTLEEIPTLITEYLDKNPKYFNTTTDEWGRTYGIK